METSCRTCGEEFKPHHALVAYCSDICRKRARSIASMEWRRNNYERALEGERVTREKRVASGALKAYQVKRRRSKAGYADRFMERIRKLTPDTDIDREFLISVLGDECSLTGVKFRYGREDLTSFTNPYAPSIDRVDSSRGYFKDNVQVVLTAVNFAKNEFSMVDFTEVLREITRSWKALTEG